LSTRASPDRSASARAFELRQILLATDLSAGCDRAFDRAVLLAREAGARLTIATALERSPDDLVEAEAQPRWRRNDGLADARRQIREDLEGKGVDARIVVRLSWSGAPELAS
jgi:nucleotide-binding universal stress UspA family protein